VVRHVHRALTCLPMATMCSPPSSPLTTGVCAYVCVFSRARACARVRVCVCVCAIPPPSSPSHLSAAVVQHEAFVPCLYVMKVKSYEEAVAKNNSVSQGLSSSLFTRDMRHVFRWMGPQVETVCIMLPCFSSLLF